MHQRAATTCNNKRFNLDTRYFKVSITIRMPALRQLIYYLWNVCVWYFFNSWVIFFEFFRKVGLFFGRLRQVSLDDDDFPESLIGRVCVITGGTRGIGEEVVRQLLKKGCHVITGSSASKETIVERHKKMMNSLGDENRGVFEIWPLDLASMDSVKNFADMILDRPLTINYLVCNGGIMFGDRKETVDGFESQFAVNYLSHALLVWLLLPKIDRPTDNDQKARIVMTTSMAHKSCRSINFDDLQFSQKYSPHYAYAESKTAVIIFTYIMDQFIKDQHLDKRVTINTLHPGLCMTDMLRGFSPLHYLFVKLFPIKRTPQEGATEILYATLSNEIEDVSGSYFDNCKESTTSSTTKDKEAQEKLWNVTWKLLGNWTDKTPVEVKESADGGVLMNHRPPLIKSRKIKPEEFVVVSHQNMV